MGVTSSKLEKALSEYPGAFLSLLMTCLSVLAILV